MKKIPKFKRLSKVQQRDFDCYINLTKDIKAFMLIDLNSDYKAQSLEEWYFLWDTHGIRCNCDNIQKAFRIIQAKASLNLTINLWVEDIEKELVTAPEIFEWCKELPTWTWKAFATKLKKLNLPVKFQQISDDLMPFYPQEIRHFSLYGIDDEDFSFIKQ